MTPFKTLTSIPAPLPLINVDTDMIIPKQFLRTIKRTGLAAGLFYEMRCDAQGNKKPDFVLNRAPYTTSTILITGANFGCGSSREHAVWGLQQFGIRAVVAPSYAEIFYSNAMNNRLLLVSLPQETIGQLMDLAGDRATNTVHIDITAQRLRCGSVEASFELMPRHRQMFLEGLDSIGLSLTYQDRIRAFADAHWARQPWLRDVAKVATAKA